MAWSVLIVAGRPSGGVFVGMYVDPVLQAESATRSAVARSDGRTGFGEAMMCKRANPNVLCCLQQYAFSLALRKKSCYLFDDFTNMY